MFSKFIHSNRNAIHLNSIQRSYKWISREATMYKRVAFYSSLSAREIAEREDQILTALRDTEEPISNKDIVSLGMVKVSNLLKLLMCQFFPKTSNCSHASSSCVLLRHYCF